MNTTEQYWNGNYNYLRAAFDGMHDARRHPNRRGACSREAVIDASEEVLHRNGAMSVRGHSAFDAIRRRGSGGTARSARSRSRSRRPSGSG